MKIFVNLDMDIEHFWPTKSDLNSLLNGFLFTMKEVDERKKTAEQTGFISWDNFLDLFLEYMKTIINWQDTFDEASIIYRDGQLRGSFLLIANKNINQKIFTKINQYNDRFLSLTEDVRTKAEAFDSKLSACMLKIMLIKIQKYEPDGLDFTLNFAKDNLQEMESFSPSFDSESKLLLSIIEDFKMKNSNTAILATKTYFYLNTNSHLFDRILEALVKEQLIDNRPDFASLFENEHLKKGVEPIKWKGNLHELSFLLWNLNGKSEFIRGGTLDKMIHRLFQFDTNKSSENIRASFNRSLKKFSDENYIGSRQKRITKILHTLSL